MIAGEAAASLSASFAALRAGVTMCETTMPAASATRMRVRRTSVHIAEPTQRHDRNVVRSGELALVGAALVGIGDRQLAYGRALRREMREEAAVQ